MEKARAEWRHATTSSWGLGHEQSCMRGTGGTRAAKGSAIHEVPCMHACMHGACMACSKLARATSTFSPAGATAF